MMPVIRPGEVTIMKNDPPLQTNAGMPVFIITGEQGEGKTTYLMEILEEISKRAIRMSGIVAPGYFSGGLRSGFSLIDVATGKTEELCMTEPAPDTVQHGRYYFRNAGISFGCNAIHNPVYEKRSDLVVIDEVGRFELSSAMWAESIDRLCTMDHPPMIWTVRKELIDAVSKRWPDNTWVIAEIKIMSQSILISHIMSEVRRYQQRADRLRKTRQPRS